MGEVAGPRSLRQLLDAVLTVGSDLDLPAMLRPDRRRARSSWSTPATARSACSTRRGTRLAQFITVGIDDDGRRAIGNLPEGHGILGLLIVDAKPLRLPDLTRAPRQLRLPAQPPADAVVPRRADPRAGRGLRQPLPDRQDGRPRCSPTSTRSWSSAWPRPPASPSRTPGSTPSCTSLGSVEDRERIARDLHDTVIQRLFATGMSLQGTVRLVAQRSDDRGRPDRGCGRRPRPHRQAHPHRDLRSRGRLASPPHGPARTASLRSHARPPGRSASSPRVLLDGPLDTGVDDRVSVELLATLREALSNVARHARATRVDVEVRGGR